MTDLSDREAPAAPRISFVSLGCPKALVDTERILTRLRAEGYAISSAHAGADAVIVNTCGFLDSAKAESLDAIGAAIAENGRVIVTGCIGAEPDAIRDAFPNVSAVTGPQAYESVWRRCTTRRPRRTRRLSTSSRQRVKLTPRHYAYLKISRAATIAAPSASSRSCAATRVAAGRRGPARSGKLVKAGSQGALGDLAGHQRIWP